MRKLHLHYPPILLFKYDEVNVCSISFGLHIRIWSGLVTFNMLLVSSLNNIFVQYDTKISCAVSTDTNIPIPIK